MWKTQINEFPEVELCDEDITIRTQIEYDLKGVKYPPSDSSVLKHLDKMFFLPNAYNSEMYQRTVCDAINHALILSLQNQTWKPDLVDTLTQVILYLMTTNHV